MFTPIHPQQRFCSSLCRRRASSRRYRRRYPEKISSANRTYRVDKPEYNKERDRRYRLGNAEKVRAKDKRLKERNAERNRQLMKAWRKANPESVRQSARDASHRRHAKKLGLPRELFEASEIFVRDKWICQLCGNSIDPLLHDRHPQSASLDHIVPFADPHFPGHLRNNVQAAHLSCNFSKSNGTLPTGEQLRLIG